MAGVHDTFMHSLNTESIQMRCFKTGQRIIFQFDAAAQLRLCFFSFPQGSNDR